jgi:DNA-binding transcriptional ArsR family regulator
VAGCGHNGRIDVSALPKSAWRYSSFSVTWSQAAYSTPPPATQPVRVCESLTQVMTPHLRATSRSKRELGVVPNLMGVGAAFRRIHISESDETSGRRFLTVWPLSEMEDVTVMFQAGFSRVAAALADPARESMLIALAGGRALPASELARAAGISPSSATAHLQKLLSVGLVAVWAQGRFRYYRLADEEVAGIIERLANFVDREQRAPAHKCRKPPDMCFARHCYDHLAGWLGVTLAESMTARGYIEVADQDVSLTSSGARWLVSEGISVEKQNSPRSVRLCLDWTERRWHLAGRIPAAILSHLLVANCLTRTKINRSLRLTPRGDRWFARMGIDVGFLHASDRLHT